MYSILSPTPHGAVGPLDEILLVAIVGITIGIMLWFVIRPAADDEDLGDGEISETEETPVEKL